MVMSKTRQQTRFSQGTAGWLMFLACTVGILMAGSARAQNEVLEVTHRSTEGFVEFTLKTAQDAAQPRVFATESPPRVVLELPDTESLLPADRIPVDSGVTEAYTTLSAGGRTRLIVDLERPTAYVHEVAGNRVTLRVAHSTTSALSSVAI